MPSRAAAAMTTGIRRRAGAHLAPCDHVEQEDPDLHRGVESRSDCEAEQQSERDREQGTAAIVELQGCQKGKPHQQTQEAHFHAAQRPKHQGEVEGDDRSRHQRSVFRPGRQRRTDPIDDNREAKQHQGASDHDRQRDLRRRDAEHVRHGHQERPGGIRESFNRWFPYVPDQALSTRQMLGIAHADHRVVDQREIETPMDLE